MVSHHMCDHWEASVAGNCQLVLLVKAFVLDAVVLVSYLGLVLEFVSRVFVSSSSPSFSWVVVEAFYCDLSPLPVVLVRSLVQLE